MKMLHIPSFLLASILLIGMYGCQNNGDCCTVIDVDVQILYKNSSGESLINSTSEFAESNIKVYYKNGADFEYIYDGNLDHPNHHRIDTDEMENLTLTVYPSYFYEGTQSTTLIELNPNVVDTLVCEFELDSNREVCKTAWLNGVELKNK